MSIKKPDYTIRDVDRYGQVRWYLRRVGMPKIRLPGEPNTPEFMAAYLEALKVGKPRRCDEIRQIVAPGSFEAIVQGYYKSKAWADLEPRTQRIRRKFLDEMIGNAGDVPAKAITAAVIRRKVESMAETPEQANAVLKTLRQVFRWAVDDEQIPTNPAAAVPYLKSNGDGFHSWTEEEVAAFEQRHPVGTRARLAMALLLYTGLRRQDVVRLGPKNLKDGIITITPAKTAKVTGVEVNIRVLPPLQEVLDRSLLGERAWIETEFARPFSPAGFGNWFRDRCDEAGLSDCSAHGLRKAGAKRAAENGATAHELMALFGWTSLKHAELYTREANRKKLAKSAVDKLGQVSN